MAVPKWYEDYLARLHPDPKIAIKIERLNNKLLKIGMFDKEKIRREIERLKKLPNFDDMATKKPTEGPKAKLMKLSVDTLRKKAKALNISNIAGRTKENLVQSIMISEARKKGAAKRKTATKQGSLFRATRVSRSGDQTGRSDIVRDGMRRAMRPGKRLSRTGKVYYERRANRSDMNPNVKPMLGEKYQGWTNYWTWRWNLEMIDPYHIWDSIDSDTSVYDLANYLKEEAYMLVEDSAQGWAQEWLNSLISSDINWREIAESVISDKEE